MLCCVLYASLGAYYSDYLIYCCRIIRYDSAHDYLAIFPLVIRRFHTYSIKALVFMRQHKTLLPDSRAIGHLDVAPTQHGYK